MAKSAVESLLSESKGLGAKAKAAMDELLGEKDVAQKAHDMKVAELESFLASKMNQLDEQIDQANEIYKLSTGNYYDAVPSKTKKVKNFSGKRTRRSREDVQAYAEKIVAFIKSKGKAGVGKDEIVAAVGEGMTGSVKDFVKKYTGVKLGDNGGAKSAMRYVVS